MNLNTETIQPSEDFNLDGKDEAADSLDTPVPKAPLNTFELRRQARVERLRVRAEKKRQEGAGYMRRADSIASFIPPGQPILGGHHSEKRHRRDLERIDTSTRKGFESIKASERLEDRAVAAECNTAIFTEDPDSLSKLEQRIAELEKLQTLMKEVNKRIRKGASLSDLGISPAREGELKKPDFLRRIGYPDYALKNNNANIRRLKLRLNSIAKAKSAPAPQDWEKDGIRVVENVEDNRVQIFFPGKPEEAIRTRLKSFGFRWSPFNVCWHYAAPRIMPRQQPQPLADKDLPAPQSA